MAKVLSDCPGSMEGKKGKKGANGAGAAAGAGQGFRRHLPPGEVPCCAYTASLRGDCIQRCVAEVYVSRAARRNPAGGGGRPVKTVLDWRSVSLERREASVPIAIANQVAATAQLLLRAPAVASVQFAKKGGWARDTYVCRAARCEFHRPGVDGAAAAPPAHQTSARLGQLKTRVSLRHLLNSAEGVDVSEFT